MGMFSKDHIMWQTNAKNRNKSKIPGLFRLNKSQDIKKKKKRKTSVVILSKSNSPAVKTGIMQ